MFGLPNDQLAVYAGGAFLAGRLLWALVRAVWLFLVDRQFALAPTIWLTFLTGVAAIFVAVGLVSAAADGLAFIIRVLIYLVTAFLAFFAGCVFDLALDIGVYRIWLWWIALRLPTLRERLLHGDDAVRLEAARMIGALGWRAGPARPELLALFKDPAPEIRTAATYAVLVAIPDPPDDDAEVQKWARLLLTDPALPVRVNAASILLACKTDPAALLPVFCEGLKSADANTFGLACRALGQIGPAAEPALPALREAIFLRETLDDGQRITITDTLTQIGAPAVPLLIELLDRSTAMNKWHVVRAIGKIGEPARAAIPALRKLVVAKISLVSDEAKKTIKKLGGDREG